MNTIIHMFMAGDTIFAALKKYNGYQLEEKQLQFLLEEFRKLNGNGPFKPGMQVQIPIFN